MTFENVLNKEILKTQKWTLDLNENKEEKGVRRQIKKKHFRVSFLQFFDKIDEGFDKFFWGVWRVSPCIQKKSKTDFSSCLSILKIS